MVLMNLLVELLLPVEALQLPPVDLPKQLMLEVQYRLQMVAVPTALGLFLNLLQHPQMTVEEY